MSSVNGASDPTVIVIGGGIAGMMAAFHIHVQLPTAKLVLLEQGSHIPYDFGSSTRSAACFRQQWGAKVNVQMSLFSAHFYKHFGEIVGDFSKLFWQRGYLFLHREKSKWRSAQERVSNQQAWGLNDVCCLGPEDVKARFSFAYTSSLLGATFCPTDGFLDPGTIIAALRDRLKNDGAVIRTKTQVVDFIRKERTITGVKVKFANSYEFIHCDYAINCTGPWAARVGEKLGTSLPVIPEKRYLWSALFRNAEDNFKQDIYDVMPFTICNDDRMTPYVKPEPTIGGNSFLIGCEHKVAASINFEPEDQDWVDPEFQVNVPGGYLEKVWEILVDWLPFTELLGFRPKVHAGFYETTPSHSPVIGFDPNYDNVIHCVGFSGHGIMHGPAAGITVADLLRFGEYRQFPGAEPFLSYRSLVEGVRDIEDMKI